MGYIDFHTHILPEMDDGAKSVGESLEMLKAAHLSGAQTVLLTPHFLTREPVPDFCARRNSKYALLKKAMEEDGGTFPTLLCGAEVPLYGGLSENNDLEKLCIEGTDLLLLELPFPAWNKWHIQEVYNIIAKQDVTPVMAHIERYLNKPKEIEKLDQFISVGAKFQMNAPSFLTFSGKRIIKALAREGLICAIGSDCHNLTSRPADISHAMSLMTKHLGGSVLREIFEKSKQLLNLS